MDLSKVFKGSLVKVIAELRSLVPKGFYMKEMSHYQKSLMLRLRRSYLKDWMGSNILNMNK